MPKRTKCEECGNYNAIVSLTCIEVLGEKRTVWLCERCHDKYEKPFKIKNEEE
jgi:protein-arginine kinase activator protein McsA